METATSVHIIAQNQTLKAQSTWPAYLVSVHQRA